MSGGSIETCRGCHQQVVRTTPRAVPDYGATLLATRSTKKDELKSALSFTRTLRRDYESVHRE